MLEGSLRLPRLGKQISVLPCYESSNLAIQQLHFGSGAAHRPAVFLHCFHIG
jgi:mannitol-1-phosphate/altronate dehydrogenase